MISVKNLRNKSSDAVESLETSFQLVARQLREAEADALRCAPPPAPVAAVPQHTRPDRKPDRVARRKLRLPDERFSMPRKKSHARTG